MEQTGTYVKILRESLERKRRYLTELLQLTNEQSMIATAEKFDDTRFSEIVEKKDVLIDNINEIDKGFSAVYDRVRTEIQADPVSYRTDLKAIQELIRTCVDLGMQIEAVEERNRTAMEQVFDTKFQGVRQMKQSKTVANKYYKSMANGMVNDSLLYDQKK
ncbi:flagellar protein FlgN [Eubacterium sp. MSJ-21]|nr:flagellar protein FlgN [Eubacterium sp. MSJ-21]